MNCKHCQAALEDGVTVCPACGKPNALPEAPATEAEETKTVPETKANPGKIALAVVAIIVVIAILAAIVVTGMERPVDTGAAEATGAVTATVPADGNPDDVTCKGSYTVTDEQAIAAADTVVATMGDKTLTNAELQIYYWMQVVTILNEYGSYASYMGLDYTQPLDTQASMVNADQTWQQYFLGCALDAWKSYEVLTMEAAAAGFDSDEDYQTYIANVREEVTASVVENGYTDINDFLTSIVGPGSSEDAYIDYLQTYYLSYLYFNDRYYAIDPTDEEVEAYFDENAETYAEEGLTKEEGTLVDVRHILLFPEGGTTNESGITTYTDEEWEACRVAAQALLDEWLAGEATEDTFAEMANTHSDDGGSNTAGGLYTYVAEGDMVTNFNDWIFDETRVAGDYGLVQTEYGYHIMYFVTSRPTWYAHAESDLIYELGSNIVPEAMEKYEMEIDYSAIALGELNLTGEEETEEVPAEEPETNNYTAAIVIAAVVLVVGGILVIGMMQQKKKNAEMPAEKTEEKSE